MLDFERVRKWAERGDAQAQYHYAFELANLPQAERNPALVAKWLRQAAQNGWESARQLIGSCGADPDDGRLYAEVRILLLKELERLRQEELAKEADDIDADQFMLAPSVESEKDSQYGDAWLLKNLPAGTKVPEAQSRVTVRTPDLNCANPSFAARLIIAVRDRFGGDAPTVYKAARIDRKTYSAIISNELRPVSKRTAVAFAFALRLTREEADAFIQSAGYSFSMSILEDMVFTACLEAGIYNWEKVNEILAMHEGFKKGNKDTLKEVENDNHM